jgi:hypothetical protein
MWWSDLETHKPSSSKGGKCGLQCIVCKHGRAKRREIEGVEILIGDECAKCNVRVAKALRRGNETSLNATVITRRASMRALWDTIVGAPTSVHLDYRHCYLELVDRRL